MQVSETPGVWNTAFKYSGTNEPSLRKCCQDAALKSLAGFGKGEKKKNLNFGFKENINEQSGSSPGVGENGVRSCSWQWPPEALPSLASWLSSVGSVIMQCCLAVQDLELLPTSVAPCNLLLLTLPVKAIVPLPTTETVFPVQLLRLWLLVLIQHHGVLA